MLRGFYTAASGILMQERTLNVLTNNMVNSQTPGFRASRVVSTTFDQEFMTRYERMNGPSAIGVGSPIRVVSDVPTQFDPSSLEETGRPFDVAINGDGFFNYQVTDAEGNQTQYLGRNGNFDIDAEGFLVLPGVGRVLGEKGTIHFEELHTDFIIETDGQVYDAEGTVIDRLLITQPPQDAKMVVAENGMFQVEDIALNEQINDRTILVQGWTERSNVDLNREYTLAIEAQRAFQACSSALQIVDKINQKAAQQIASL